MRIGHTSEESQMRSPAPATPNRHLKLEGTRNVRDTGGYATADGRITRWRTLLRGDSLHRLTSQGQSELVVMGLRTVIDLRHDTELANAPNVFATSDQVYYLHISLLDDIPDAAREQPATLDDVYMRIVEGSQAQLRAVFAALAGPDALPALVHCAGGKDRTGMVIALLLANAGVPAPVIAADYALSEQYLGPDIVAEMRARIIAAGGNWDRYAPLMGSPSSVMLQILTVIEERHGSVPHYLQSIGVSEATLATLRTALTGDPADIQVTIAMPAQSLPA
jgi:protein-tyrosine phosphatase